jgi:polyhydroxyalkanoate synthesis regulator phasin
MDAQTLIAITGLITGVGGLILALYSNASSARKTEMESLRATVEALQTENSRQAAKIANQAAKIDDQAARITELEKSRDALDGENVDLRQENAKLIERVDCLEREIAATRGDPAPAATNNKPPKAAGRKR